MVVKMNDALPTGNRRHSVPYGTEREVAYAFSTDILSRRDRKTGSPCPAGYKMPVENVVKYTTCPDGDKKTGRPCPVRDKMLVETLPATYMSRPAEGRNVGRIDESISREGWNVKEDDAVISGKINDGGGRPLLLFFAGWGMDEHPFLEYLPAGMDCVVCYDYSSLAFDASVLESCGRIRVVAWSMGVWAASRVLSGLTLPAATERIAINGTPWPVDDERGIAAAIFRGTLANLNETTLQKFRRRMCGSDETLRRFMEHAPRRTLEDIGGELEQIGRLAAAGCPPPFRWDRIYIGLHDRIFLPDNQRKAWEGREVIPVECGHYPPPELWRELFED
jgi:hypothetical protein